MLTKISAGLANRTLAVEFLQVVIIYASVTAKDLTAESLAAFEHYLKTL